jgi:hypothetical protein
MQSNLMKPFLLTWCLAILLIGCSKMETEDPITADQTSQQDSKSLATSNAINPATPSGMQEEHPELKKSITSILEPQQLTLKWPVGKRFVYEIGIDQVTSAGNSPLAAAMNSKADQNFTYALTTRKDPASGKTQLEMEFLAAKLNMDMMGNKLNYDSDNKKAAESIDPMHSMLAGLDALMGQKLTMTLNAAGEITSVEGMDEMVEKVINALPAAAKSVAQGIVQEDQFKQLIQYPFLPETAVKGGDKWNRIYTQVFGISGAMDIDNAYTYLGQTTQGEVQLNVLSYEGKVLAGQDQMDEMMGMKISMEGGKNTGLIKLDQISGHIVESDATQEMTMLMSVPEAMKAMLPGETKISIQMSQKIRLKEVTDADNSAK